MICQFCGCRIRTPHRRGTRIYCSEFHANADMYNVVPGTAAIRVTGVHEARCDCWTCRIGREAVGQ
jgi:hypothetical protein